MTEIDALKLIHDTRERGINGYLADLQQSVGFKEYLEQVAKGTPNTKIELQNVISIRGMFDRNFSLATYITASDKLCEDIDKSFRKLILGEK